MKVSELNPPELDYFVAKAHGWERARKFDGQCSYYVWMTKPGGGSQEVHGENKWHPSTDWSQGGPIMEREWTNIIEVLNRWARTKPEFFAWHAPDVILKNFMRAWVASVVGEEVGED